jgi:hypothetical protein
VLLLLLLALQLKQSKQQPDVTVIPTLAPYPPTQPFDVGYPGNIPLGVWLFQWCIYTQTQFRHGAPLGPSG